MTKYIIVFMSILSLFCADTCAADDGGWILYYEDLFDRNSLGSDWAVLNGEFKTIYDAPSGLGTLYARGEVILLRRFPGDVRIEMEASSKEPGDLSITLATNERGFMGGYFMGFGSENNTISKILRLRKKVVISNAKIILSKMHKIVAEKSGEVVTMTVDGKEIMRFEDPQPLSGFAHEMIGLYFYNLATIDCVRVYGKKGHEPIKLTELPETAETSTEVKVPPLKTGKNLIGNPSFEDTMPGIWPRLPALWVPEYSAVGDRPQLVKDPTQAHRGDRFIQLQGKGPWMKIHNIGTEGSGVPLEGEKTYEFKVWAKSSEPGSSAIEFRPSSKKFPLTSDWQEFVVTWKAPANLPKHEKGFYLKAFGSADIDDVSICEKGYQPEILPELKADRTKLKVILPVPEWLDEAGKLKHRERVVLEVSEVFGKPAKSTPAAVTIAELFGSLPAYDFVSTEKMRIVDGPTGKDVLFTIQEVDLHPTITGGDLVVFLTDVPALSRKMYYVYLVDREPLKEEIFPVSQLPKNLSGYSKEPRRLLTEVKKRERIGALRIKRKENKILFEVTALPNTYISGKVYSPEKKKLNISFRRVSKSPLWRSKFVLPEDAAKGIWSVSVNLGDATGWKEKVKGVFVVDAGIWSGGNLTVIHSDDPPSPGKGEAHLIAARGERESFQVAIVTERTLHAVKINAGELKQVNGPGRIPAENWTLERVEELFVGVTHPSPVLRLVGDEFVNAGNYPDPLLPWREVDIEAGTQRVCLATIRIPHHIPAGKYFGTITAQAHDGTKLSLPVNLRVYDFDIPKHPSFTSMICGWNAYVSVPRDRDGRFGKDVKYYHFWDEEAADELALFVAQKWMTPAMTATAFGANAIPWTYDPKTRTASLNFERFDKNAEILIDQFNIDFISIPWHSGWRTVTSIYTYPPLDQWPSGWGTVYKDSPGRISKRLNTEEGFQMMEDYARTLGKHLEKKGWLDKVIIYIVDEPKSQEVYEAVLNTAKAIRRGHPKLQMWGAGYGTSWYGYFDHIDVFTGQIAGRIRKKFKEMGIRYFGVYNQQIDFLAIPRVMALYGWSQGWDGYYHHETTTNQDAWINPEPPVWANRYVPEYAVGPADAWMLIGSSIYHWPEDEPLPGGKRRAWASSLRIEAFRESVEDVEYLKILKDLAEKSPSGSRTQRQFEELEARVKQWVQKGSLTLQHNRYYNYRLDEEELFNIRRLVCEVIEKAKK